MDRAVVDRELATQGSADYPWHMRDERVMDEYWRIYALAHAWLSIYGELPDAADPEWQAFEAGADERMIEALDHLPADLRALLDTDRCGAKVAPEGPSLCQLASGHSGPHELERVGPRGRAVYFWDGHGERQLRSALEDIGVTLIDD